MSLSKADILNAKDFKCEEVSVPEWGGHVFVRTMTGAQRDSFEASLVNVLGETTTPNLQNVRAKLLARCLCDEHGERLFNDAEIEALGAKSAAALDRVFKVAQTLNGIGEKEIEELAGN